MWTWTRRLGKYPVAGRCPLSGVRWDLSNGSGIMSMSDHGGIADFDRRHQSFGRMGRQCVTTGCYSYFKWEERCEGRRGYGHGCFC